MFTAIGRFAVRIIYSLMARGGRLVTKSWNIGRWVSKTWLGRVLGTIGITVGAEAAIALALETGLSLTADWAGLRANVGKVQTIPTILLGLVEWFNTGFPVSDLISSAATYYLCAGFAAKIARLERAAREKMNVHWRTGSTLGPP